MIYYRIIGIICCLLIITSLEVVDAKRKHRKNFVIKGKNAPKKKFKWMARVLTPTIYCGGSLITAKHVLTASHCIGQTAASKLEVILGDWRFHNKDRTEQKKKVKSYHKYEPQGVNGDDWGVAILVLAKKAKLNGAVRYILLRQTLPPTNSICTLSGWGRTQGDVPQPANILQYINYPTASHTDCKNEQAVTLKPWQLCVGQPTGTYVGACHGDSGSPFVYPNAFTTNNPRLVAFPYGGVQNCPPPLHYRHFISVPAVYDWIVEKIGCSLPGKWQTVWINNDDPKSDRADNETYTSAARPCKKGNKKPICIQKKVVSTSNCRKIHRRCAKPKSQRVNMDVSFGLSCVNENQKMIKGKRCKCCDYAVRYKCPS